MGQRDVRAPPSYLLVSEFLSTGPAAVAGICSWSTQLPSSGLESWVNERTRVEQTCSALAVAGCGAAWPALPLCDDE